MQCKGFHLEKLGEGFKFVRKPHGFIWTKELALHAVNADWHLPSKRQPDYWYTEHDIAIYDLCKKSQNACRKTSGVWWQTRKGARK